MKPESGFIQTYSGKKIWPLDPDPADICIEDIAHALSNNCRYTGHVKKFYSVAQHSVHASENVPQELALTALMHDASEAYLSDLARPIKHAPEMEAYRKAEAVLEKVISEKYGLIYPYPKEIKTADNKMLYTERRDLLPRVEWTTDTKNVLGVEGDDERTPYKFHIVPWLPEKAEIEFLMRWTELTETK